jgi:long-chain acyl-CoA synthetase
MNVENLAELHRRQARRYGPRTALRYKAHGLYHDVSWDRYLADAHACAAALLAHGVRPGDRVGLLAENRLEWLLADMGILAAGAVNVPAHPTLSARQLAEQFAHAEISWLFVAGTALYAKVRDLPRQVAGLHGVVLFDRVPGADVPTWPAFLLEGRRALARLGGELDQRITRLGRDDLATLMYTSGTTGNSKGVMLTHGNLLSNALSMVTGAGVSDDAIVLSWLPYSHIYGRLVDHYLTLAAGATLCLAERQETLLENLQEIRPTNFSAVPRFYEKVLAAVSAAGPAEARQRLRQLFGPRIEWLNSGGAPLPLHVAQAYTDAGLVLLQGYGLTETSPVITFNRKDANRLGTVGQPVPGVEVRIAPDGEILTRGPHVMKGYWKDPQATAETIRDGWLHTGDLGHLDADGYLTITGRKKDLLVLSNGKKVVPAQLEGLLAADECIDQALVYGEGRSYLTALIVPRFDALRAAARARGIDEPDDARLVQHPDVQALMLARVQAALADLASHEQVQRIVLLPRPFTQEADEMTVSLKLRRGVIFQKYAPLLEALYA